MDFTKVPAFGDGDSRAEGDDDWRRRPVPSAFVASPLPREREAAWGYVPSEHGGHGGQAGGGSAEDWTRGSQHGSIVKRSVTSCLVAPQLSALMAWPAHVHMRLSRTF